MTEKNNDKKKIWIYAVVLFTSAFIVLLLTAISQIKLNKNIDDYKTQIYTNEKEKSDFQLNLSSSKNQNKKLQDELKTTKEDLEKELKENENESQKYKDLELKLSKSINSYEKLLQAENEFLNENFIAAAVILQKQCDIKYLNEQAMKRYVSLKDSTYKKASKELYINGLKNYNAGLYNNAIEAFQLSAELVSYEYYSDDCYYYIAYSYYKAGKYDLASSTVDNLIKNYPSSSYIDDAYDLLKIMKK